MSDLEILRDACKIVDDVLSRHNLDGIRVDGGVFTARRVAFRVPLAGFDGLERDLTAALGGGRVALILEVEVKR